MFQLYADKNQLELCPREQGHVTSGSVNVYPVRFTFSEDWDGLARTVIFRAGVKSRAVLLGEDNEAVIPWEVLKIPGPQLFCGVYGTQGGRTVLPTVWASLGTIFEGAADKELSQPPTPGLYQQILAAAAEALEAVQSVRADAESGAFIGPQGPQGEQGETGPQGPQGEKGNLYFAAFTVEPQTGRLIMWTPDEYDGPGFRLENGILEVVING